MRNENIGCDILFLLHIPPPVHGSSMVGKYIQESTRINNKFSCRYINLLASKKIEETGSLNLRKIGEFVLVWSKLLKELILGRKIDLCYFALTTTGIAFFKDVLLVSLLKVFKIKIVFHLHNKGIVNFQDKTIYRICYRYVFKRTTVILLSNSLYKDIEAFVPKGNVFICPNGVPDNQNISSNGINVINNSDVRILFLSNLIESKGVYVLLEACSELRQRGVEFKCDFIGGRGDVSIAEFEKKVEEHCLSDSVSYLGKKYGKEKYKALSQADIFVFPTFYKNECFPLVLLEAMQFGLPIISTFEGGIRDIVVDNKTGFLLKEIDSKELATKIEKLILDQEMRLGMGKAGKEKYLNEFTIQIFEERMIEILENVL